MAFNTIQAHIITRFWNSKMTFLCWILDFLTKRTQKAEGKWHQVWSQLPSLGDFHFKAVIHGVTEEITDSNDDKTEAISWTCRYKKTWFSAVYTVDIFICLSRSTTVGFRLKFSHILLACFKAAPSLEVCVLDLPCSSLLRDSQTVQVRLLPAASSSLLQLVVVAGQEGASWIAGRGVFLAVVLRVPLISDVVHVFRAAVLVSNCRESWFCSRQEQKQPTCWDVWPGVPGGPGAVRDGMFWWSLAPLERLWLKLCLVGPETFLEHI